MSMTLIYPDVDIANVRRKDLSIDVAFIGHIVAHVVVVVTTKGNDGYLFGYRRSLSIIG